MTDEFTLDYRMTPKEMISALQSRIRRGMFYRVALIILIATLGLAGIFIVPASLEDSSPVSLYYSLVPFIFFILAFILMFYVNPFLSWQVRRDPKLFVEQTWQFSYEGIQIKTVDAESQCSWSAFAKASEDKHFFFLFLNERVFNVIPKRAMASPAEETRLRELLRRKIDKWI